MDDTLGMNNDVLARSVLGALDENPQLKQAELAAQFGVSVPTVKRAIKKLVELKLVRRVGGKRYGHWEVAG